MKTAALLLCLAMLLSIMPASALAADYAAEAKEALQHLDEPFVNALASDDAEALYAAGLDYYGRYMVKFPDGAEEDIRRAHRLYLKAAELGLPEAQVAAAGDYTLGMENPPVENNQEEAFSWLLKAAEQGYPYAYAAVISAFRSGTGTKQDEEAARRWEDKAAAEAAQILEAVNAPDADAEKLYLAGEIYRYGTGAEKDAEKAAECWQRAAEAGSGKAARALGELYRLGTDVPRDLDKAIEWFTKAYELGDKDSASALVSLYRYGGDEYGHYKDASKAAAILQSLASAGDAVSQAALAELYMSGEGVEWDSAKAFEWLLKAAAQDYAYAEMEIADIFEYGLKGSASDTLIEADHALAEAWRARAIGQGYTVYRPDSP